MLCLTGLSAHVHDTPLTANDCDKSAISFLMHLSLINPTSRVSTSISILGICAQTKILNLPEKLQAEQQASGFAQPWADVDPPPVLFRHVYNSSLGIVVEIYQV